VRGRDDLARALSATAVGSDGWDQGRRLPRGGRGPLDRDVLDEVSPPVPVRVPAPQWRAVDAELGGLARVGLIDHPDGRLRRPIAVGQTRCSRHEVDC